MELVEDSPKRIHGRFFKAKSKPKSYVEEIINLKNEISEDTEQIYKNHQIELQRILTILIENTNIKYFLRTNYLKEELVKKAIMKSRIVYLEKHRYLFKQNDRSKNCYLLISGKISLRKRLDFSNQNQYYFERDPQVCSEDLSLQEAEEDEIIEGEEEIFCENEGFFFGEWGIIECKPRTCSIYTLTESYFLSLDRDSFEETLEDSLKLAEKKKKAIFNE